MIEDMKGVSPSIPTFMCGDFNFIETPADSSNPDPTLPPSSFLTLFATLREFFSVKEVPHHEHTYYHITDNPTGPYSTSSRLDRLLIPSALFDNPIITPHAAVFYHRTNYRPSGAGPRQSFSDHLPVSLTFLSDTREKSNRPTIPQWLALAPGFETALRSVWTPRGNTTTTPSGPSNSTRGRSSGPRQSPGHPH